MNNGEYVKNDFQDQCPVHCKIVKKEYNFGKYLDAIVYSYSCGCACSYDSERGFYKGAAYFNSYKGAESHARATVCGNSSR